MTTEVAVRSDLDSCALIVSVLPENTAEQVRAAVDSSAEQHPGAVVLDLRGARRWTALRGLARICLRHTVPLLVVPVLATPVPAAAVRSLAAPLAVHMHPTVAEALASLPSATVPTAHQRRIRLPAEPVAAALARTEAAATLRSWGLDELLFPVELITSELVSNAVLHAGSPAELLLRLGPDGVRVAVHDQDPRPPVFAGDPADAEREGGRGLYLVARASQRWGCVRGTSDKVIWADVRPANQGGSSHSNQRFACGDGR